MKKLLSVLTIAAVICLGVIGALAVIPHAHGNDLGHSSHESCPIHQFGLGHVHADIALVNAVIALFLLFYCIAFQKTLPIIVSGTTSFLRGPPARR